MKKFADWFESNSGEKMPSGTINGSWFAKRGLPMIVECCCCCSTMSLPSAYIDEDDYIYCPTCAGDEQ